MSRIFSINFRYNDETYSTMVSVRTLPLYMEYTLNNLDGEVLRLLPGNVIVSPSPRQFYFADHSPCASSRLMNSIIKAICVRVQATSPSPSGGGEIW